MSLNRETKNYKMKLIGHEKIVVSGKLFFLV